MFIFVSWCICYIVFFAYDEFVPGPKINDRMSTIHVQYVGTSCKLTIIPMRAGRSGKGKQKKKGKVLQTQFVVVNTCMFKWQCVFYHCDL